MSSIPNKTPVTKYSLTKCISKLPWRFEIHWVGQYLVDLTDLAGIANATVHSITFIYIANSMAVVDIAQNISSGYTDLDLPEYLVSAPERVNILPMVHFTQMLIPSYLELWSNGISPNRPWYMYDTDLCPQHKSRRIYLLDIGEFIKQYQLLGIKGTAKLVMRYSGTCNHDAMFNLWPLIY